MSMFGRRGGGGRRSDPRQITPLTAVFTTVTKSRAVELVDIGATGAKLRGNYLPAKNEELLLSIGSVRTFGTVAWSLRDECGVQFECALADNEVQQLREKADGARGLTLDAKEALDAWTLGMAR
jgi:PilZ domain